MVFSSDSVRESLGDLAATAASVLTFSSRKAPVFFTELPAPPLAGGTATRAGLAGEVHCLPFLVALRSGTDRNQRDFACKELKI